MTKFSVFVNRSKFGKPKWEPVGVFDVKDKNTAMEHASRRVTVSLGFLKCQTVKEAV
jgi:hypothetical protein